MISCRFSSCCTEPEPPRSLREVAINRDLGSKGGALSVALSSKIRPEGGLRARPWRLAALVEQRALHAQPRHAELMLQQRQVVGRNPLAGQPHDAGHGAVGVGELPYRGAKGGRVPRRT